MNATCAPAQVTQELGSQQARKVLAHRVFARHPSVAPVRMTGRPPSMYRDLKSCSEIEAALSRGRVHSSCGSSAAPARRGRQTSSAAPLRARACEGLS